MEPGNLQREQCLFGYRAVSDRILFPLLFSVSLQSVTLLIATGRNRSGSLSQEATSELVGPVCCFPATEPDGDRIRLCLHGPLLRPAVLQRERLLRFSLVPGFVVCGACGRRVSCFYCATPLKHVSSVQCDKRHYNCHYVNLPAVITGWVDDGDV